MILLAIDPGPTESGYVIWDGERARMAGTLPNDSLLKSLYNFRQGPLYSVAIEMIGHYGTGMPAGKEVFETCIWIGRFMEAFGADRCTRLLRATIKTHLCGTPRAKDANVRAALIDRFGKPGTKKAPGPLYGVSGHAWAALALAVCCWDRQAVERIA